MARGGRITIEGQQALTRKLNALEGKVARKVVRQAMRAAMKPMLDQIKGNVPIGETGAMKASVKLRAMKRSRKRYGVEVRVESSGIGAVEYGTVDQSPQAPLRRGFDAEKSAAMARVLDLLRAGIEREASRN